MKYPILLFVFSLFVMPEISWAQAEGSGSLAGDAGMARAYASLESSPKAVLAKVREEAQKTPILPAKSSPVSPQSKMPSPVERQAVQMAEDYVRSHPEFRVLADEPLLVTRVEAFYLAKQLYGEVRFAPQYYQGMLVEGSEIIVDIWEGRIVRAWGMHTYLNAFPAGPKLSADQALKRVVGVEVVYGTPNGEGRYVITPADVQSFHEARLGIIYVGPANEAHLAWEISVSDFYICVDAQDGSILKSHLRIKF